MLMTYLQSINSSVQKDRREMTKTKAWHRLSTTAKVFSQSKPSKLTTKSAGDFSGRDGNTDEMTWSSWLSFKQKEWDNRTVVYNRLPKTGSRTISFIADQIHKRNNYTKTVYDPTVEGFLPPTLVRKVVMEIEMMPRPLVYMNHLRFVDFTMFGKKQPIYFNVVREPIERFVSFYYFRRFGDGEINNGKPLYLRNESIDECVYNRRHECTGEEKLWLTLGFFCGHDELCKTPNRDALDKAKRNIERFYMFVGLSSNMDDVIFILETYLPAYFKGAQDFWQKQKMEQMAVHKTSFKKPIGARARNILRKTMNLEYELYYFIKDRFEDLLQQISLPG